MNRDELLTQMAMENAQWPAWGGQPVLHGDQWFLPDEYQQRRNELINKPSWDNAPEWAQWLAQDADGDWVWFEVEPEPDHEEWLEKENFDGDIEEASKGKTPSGHDWRETLERRLEWPEDRMDVIGSNGPTGDHYMTQEEEDMPAWDVTIKRAGERGNVKISELAKALYGDPVKDSWRELAEQNKRPGRSKYHREIKPGVFVDVYDVLTAWRVTNPALQHLIKKALQPGGRGHKTLEQDMADIVASAKRAAELGDS